MTPSREQLDAAVAKAAGWYRDEQRNSWYSPDTKIVRGMPVIAYTHPSTDWRVLMAAVGRLEKETDCIFRRTNWVWIAAQQDCCAPGGYLDLHAENIDLGEPTMEAEAVARCIHAVMEREDG